MAERRMFAKTIIDSDAFLDMPVTARLLYYDLSMRGDDDGFVNSPKKIMRMVGASQDDLNILILKKFIIPFDNGVVVIKHWKIHNYIRKDTYKETTYKEQKSLLELDENCSYRLKNGSRPRLVDEPSTQDRIGQDSLDKDSINIYVQEFDELWELYPRKQGKTNALKSYIKARKEGVTKEEVEQGILDYGAYIKKNNVEGKYIKMGSTWFNQRCWTDDLSMRVKSGRLDWIDEVEL